MNSTVAFESFTARIEAPDGCVPGDFGEEVLIRRNRRAAGPEQSLVVITFGFDRLGYLPRAVAEVLLPELDARRITLWGGRLGAKIPLGAAGRYTRELEVQYQIKETTS